VAMEKEGYILVWIGCLGVRDSASVVGQVPQLLYESESTSYVTRDKPTAVKTSSPVVFFPTFTSSSVKSHVSFAVVDSSTKPSLNSDPILLARSNSSLFQEQISRNLLLHKELPHRPLLHRS